MARDFEEVFKTATTEEMTAVIVLAKDQIEDWEDAITDDARIVEDPHVVLDTQKKLAQEYISHRNNICQIFADAVGTPNDYGEPLADNDYEITKLISGYQPS